MAAIDIKPPVDRYKAIADAIREKNGTTELMHPADMPQAILDIVGDGDVTIGADYTNIVYNEDDTITLTDKDGVEHTMECEYTDGKLTSVKYDGKAVELTYDGDVLVKVGKAAVDVASAQTSSIEPLDHTVKFMVEGEPYEVVSVKDGNKINGTVTIPTSELGTFCYWEDENGNMVDFPFTPINDSILIAHIQSVRKEIEVKTAGAYVCKTLGYKTTDEVALFGQWNTLSGDEYGFLVGRTETSIATSFVTDETGTIEYNGETWYYKLDCYYEGDVNDGEIQPYYVGHSKSVAKADVPKKILDYYFYKI
jgi:hypothetical protein